MTIVRPLPSEQLTKLEISHLLVLARAAREDIDHRKMHLEERFAVHGNGPTNNALLALAGELKILEDVIAKLWRMSQ